MATMSSTNGRTVWVNGPRSILARYCPVSGEVWPSNAKLTDGPQTVLGEPWGAWVERVALVHGVTVSDALRPAWSRESCSRSRPATGASPS
jgi:glycine cleavage system H lipoate-binding protein